MKIGTAELFMHIFNAMNVLALVGIVINKTITNFDIKIYMLLLIKIMSVVYVAKSDTMHFCKVSTSSITKVIKYVKRT